MVQRKIIHIDVNRCNGCGLCLPKCPERAINIIDGKARLVGDILCDGLGACLGFCPEGAITIETRDAEPYDERKAIELMAKAGPGVVYAHLERLQKQGEQAHLAEALQYLSENGLPIPLEFAGTGTPLLEAPPACPSVDIMDFIEDAPGEAANPSRLRNWPIQLALVPPGASFLNGAHLLIAAHCVPFAYADFHERLLKGRHCLIGCPKLDDSQQHLRKLTAVLEANEIRSITIAHMEVPCCFALAKLVESALELAGKSIPVQTRIVSIKGAPVAASPSPGGITTNA